MQDDVEVVRACTARRCMCMCSRVESVICAVRVRRAHAHGGSRSARTSRDQGARDTWGAWALSVFARWSCKAVLEGARHVRMCARRGRCERRASTGCAMRVQSPRGVEIASGCAPEGASRGSDGRTLSEVCMHAMHACDVVTAWSWVTAGTCVGRLVAAPHGMDCAYATPHVRGGRHGMWRGSVD